VRRADSERGFALISALVVAFLFFTLVGLLMIESTAVLRAAHHFRSRLVAQNLAESGAELAARSMVISGSSTIETEVEEGSITGEYTTTQTLDPSVKDFVIVGTGTTVGTDPMTAEVKIYGTLTNGNIVITQTEHTQ
jgi:hypothetical protein